MATALGEITAMRAVRGHSRSSLLAPIECLCATSYYWI